MSIKKTAKQMPNIEPTMSASEDQRIHQERGDFLLPQIFDYISERKWIDPRPIYQRRLVWDNKRKSRFLESLFLNFPVPPLFLFEHRYGEWEIMDGQQRSSAIVDFYNGSLRISGLERCKDLNGKTYNECSPIVQKLFDRRRVQVTTILAESGAGANFDVRKEVFERLNTGGKPLNPQEIRNCLWAGNFCDLLDELSSLPLFTRMWGIPRHNSPRSMKTFPKELLDDPMFSRMIDCELVLRFFAFEHTRFLSGATKTALDKCMEYYYSADAATLDSLREKFINRLSLVNKVFGDDAFQIPSGVSGEKRAKKLYDSLMSAIGQFAESKSSLISGKNKLRSRLNALIADEATYNVLITQHDSKTGFHNRVNLIAEMIRNGIK